MRTSTLVVDIRGYYLQRKQSFCFPTLKVHVIAYEMSRISESHFLTVPLQHMKQFCSDRKTVICDELDINSASDNFLSCAHSYHGQAIQE